jgi:hypothetical protein
MGGMDNRPLARLPLFVITNRFPSTANNGKLRQSLSFFGEERRKIAGLTEIAIE